MNLVFAALFLVSSSWAAPVWLESRSQAEAAVKGSGQSTPALVGGQVQMMFAITSIGLPQVQNGKVRGLGVSSAQRTPLAPALPTIAESGYPGYEVTGWNGLLAPAGTPRAVIAKLNAEVSRAMKQPDLVQRLSGAFYDVAAPNTPEQFGAYIRQEIAKWAKLVKDTGAKVD